VFAVLFWVIGIDQIYDALLGADLGLVGVAVALMVAWVVVQGIALWTVWDSLGIDAPPWSAVLVFAGAAFANNITPFGQAGGEPIAALLTTDVTDAEYESSLAAIAGADALNFVPSTSFALVGCATYAVVSTLTAQLRSVLFILVSFGVGVSALGLVVWRTRATVERTVVRIAKPPLRTLARIVPRVSVPTPERIEAGFQQFFTAIERIATNRRNLAIALLFSTLGLLMQSSAMWVTFQALGAGIPYYVPLFVIPIGTMAAVGPTPGGLGSIESVHIFLLTAMTSAPAPVVAAAVVIHSIGGYWLTMTVGAGSMGVIRSRTH